MRWVIVPALLCTVAVLTGATDGAAQLFLPSFEYGTGDLPTCTALGDLNGDWNTDAVVAVYGASHAAVFLGNGDGTLQSGVDYATGTGPYGVVLALLDADAHLDMAIARYDGYLAVLRGNGDGTFQAYTEYAAGSGPSSLAAADLDGDGDQDLVVGNLVGGNLSVFLGNGDGTFGAAVNYASGPKPRYVAIEDLNEDGALDIAVPNENGYTLSVLLGDGDGTFGLPVGYPAGATPYGIAASDLDYDGHQDLAVADRYWDFIRVYLGSGDGTFPTHIEYSAGDGPEFVGASDMDGDGKTDLMTVNVYSSDVSFLRGNGDGTYEAHVDYATAGGPHQAAIGDLDWDGDRDLVVVCQGSDSLSVFLNTSGVPVEPTITRITDVGNDQGRQVRIEWLRSRHDAVGDTMGITGYEIYRHEDGRLDEWDYIATVPAHTDSAYQCVVPTLCDSTLAYGYCPTTFLVRATTAVPWVYFTSEPATGYSVDNLAPGVPAGLVVAYHSPGGNALSWDECGDDDFQYFKIYRGDSEEFVPAPENLIHMSIDPVWTDPSGSGWDHYKVSAVDHAGNESAAGSPEALTGIDGVIPKAYALSHSFPNPFNPITHIAFDIPEPGCSVALRVFDSAGHVVETLMDSWMPPGRYTETWNGTDSAGRELGSGVYFCVLDAPGFSERRKMVLLK